MPIGGGVTVLSAGVIKICYLGEWVWTLDNELYLWAVVTSLPPTRGQKRPLHVKTELHSEAYWERHLTFLTHSLPFSSLGIFTESIIDFDWSCPLTCPTAKIIYLTMFLWHLMFSFILFFIDLYLKYQ